MSKPPETAADWPRGCWVADTRAAASPASDATMEMNDRRSCGTDIRCSSNGTITLWPRVVDSIPRQFLRTIIAFLEREHRSGLRVDERRQLLRVLVGQVARI